MKTHIENQHGLTLIEMLVSLLLFLLASSLIITSVSYVIDIPKQASIMTDLQVYRLEVALALNEIPDDLNEDEFKAILNKNLEEKYKIKADNKSTLVNPYKNPFILEYKKEGEQLEITIKTVGKKVEQVYTLVIIKEGKISDYCTNGFGRNNVSTTSLNSKQCTNISKEDPPKPLVDSTDAVVRLPLEGKGTDIEPYIITTIGELQAIEKCLSCYYKLGNDIDATGTKTWNAGKGFIPLGQADFFTGDLNGNNKTVSNLYINNVTSSYYTGLFKFIYTNNIAKGVYNLALKDVDITGLDFTGGLTGGVNTSKVNQVSITGIINAKKGYVGGVSGYSAATTITDSLVIAEVVGETTIGGFVGMNTTGKIKNAFFKGVLRTRINGIDETNFVVGTDFSFGDPSAFVNLYFDGETSSHYYKTTTLNTARTGFNPTQTTKLTTDQAKNQSSYQNWDFANVWSINPTINNGYPYLKNNPPN